MTSAPAWRALFERHALAVSLVALLLAGAVVALGVAVAPETFYDRFVWEDLYGPLVVDARQCHTAAACPGLDSPPGIAVKDGYTITSELTYGLVLALLLYGIYVGIFRRFRIVADGWFVLGLLPWILLGPLARVLEDANVFCKEGTDCDPGVFAYLFISPVIYIHIALYVIPALLLGVYLQRRRAADWRRLTLPIAALLGLGVALYAAIGNAYSRGFTALPPLWFVALTALAGVALFASRARRGLVSTNLTVFVLGMPYALGCLYLIARWIAGDVWAPSAWSGTMYLDAGAFVLVAAALVASLVYLAGRRLPGAQWLGRLGARADRVPRAVEKRIGWAGGIALTLGLLMAGILPNLTPFFDGVPNKATVIPALMLGGFLLLVAFVAIHVLRTAAAKPQMLASYAVGINVALVLGHMIDGLATWTALDDPLGFGIPPYSEKHPFSDFLLGYWGGFLFPFTKLVMVLVVIWLLDRETARQGANEAKGDEEATSHDERNMVGLVKMAIFVLGFAPGLRDVLRLTMGV